MDIETSRIFLATMITAIPTVMTLSLIALFAFPRTKYNWIRKKHLAIYFIVLGIVAFLFLYATYALLMNFDSLLKLDGLYEYSNTLGTYVILDINPIANSLTHAVRVLIFLPGFILGYLFLLVYLETDRVKNKKPKKSKGKAKDKKSK
jgi:hypothetical protein